MAANPVSGADLRGVTHVGLDADDTLWHSENRFQEAHQRFHDLIADHVDLQPEELDARMLETEQRNLELFGYGAKGFTLSLVETAIEVTGATIGADDIARILDFGKDLLAHPVELLAGVDQTVRALREQGTELLLITKGDLWHQESKIAASGISDAFLGIEIVSEKSPATYAAILTRYDIEPGRFCMVGNSVRSDVLPVLEIGGHAVHVPYDYLWAHEAVDDPGHDFPTISHITDLLPLLDQGPTPTA